MHHMSGLEFHLEMQIDKLHELLILDQEKTLPFQRLVIVSSSD